MAFTNNDKSKIFIFGLVSSWKALLKPTLPFFIFNVGDNQKMQIKNLFVITFLLIASNFYSQNTFIRKLCINCEST